MRLRYTVGQTHLEISTASNGPYVLHGAQSPGRHRLTFMFYFSGWPAHGPRVLDGHLLLSAPNGVPAVGRAYLIPNSSGWETGCRLDFVLELDSLQLERLCDLRVGGGANMQLRADLTLIVSGSEGVKNISGDEILSLPPKMWFDALSNAGFGDTLVNEITVPRSIAAPDLASALSALRDALGAFRDAAGGDARARDTVSTCRLAFDGGNLDANKPPQLQPLTRAMTDPMSKEERLRTLRWALKLLTHLAHHDATVQWSKRDARLITSATAVLLEWQAGHD